MRKAGSFVVQAFLVLLDLRIQPCLLNALCLTTKSQAFGK